MDDFFTTRLLTRRQIDQAYAVARMVVPDLTVECWRDFAAALIQDAGDPDPSATEGPAAASGIMTVQTHQGYIHGLFSFRTDPHLRHGRVLTVDNFMVVDMVDPAGTASLLLRAMDRTAHALGCSAIHTTLPANYAQLPEYCNAVLTYFRDDGHAVDTLRLCKTVDGANDNESQIPARVTAGEGE